MLQILKKMQEMLQILKKIKKLLQNSASSRSGASTESRRPGPRSEDLAWTAGYAAAAGYGFGVMSGKILKINNHSF